MAQGFQAKSPRIHHPPRPSKNTLIRAPGRLKADAIGIAGARADSRRNTIIVMLATLHDRAPNTYYGQWPEEKAAISGPRIAGHCPYARVGHNDVVVSYWRRDTTST
jgi:hypothetical protein